MPDSPNAEELFIRLYLDRHIMLETMTADELHNKLVHLEQFKD